MELIRPDYVVLIVEELDRALRFYTEVLGLRLGHCSGEYAQFDTGATRLALYTRRAMTKTFTSGSQGKVITSMGCVVSMRPMNKDDVASEIRVIS
jgi:extradiol dioxygenase family protein